MSGLRMTARMKARGLDLQLQLGPHERLAVLGANGAGKSTVLSILSGALRPDSGTAVLGDRTLFDLDARPEVWLPPHARGVALLAQKPLLFPHLSVLDNVAFGPRARGAHRRPAREEAMRWLSEVDAAEFANRRPAQLSGGQAQRVAIARALAADPQLLLLDEPMAALDVSATPMLRRVLRRVLDERSALIVTHDLLDAFVLATRVIVIEEGKVVESGTTDEVIARPRTAFTAGIAGVNLVRGTATGAAELIAAGGQVPVAGTTTAPLTPGMSALAVFSPNAVAVYGAAPHGSPRNTFAVTVSELEPRDAHVRVRAHDTSGHSLLADVTAAAVSELDLYPGKDVHFSVKATAVDLYAA